MSDSEDYGEEGSMGYGSDDEPVMYDYGYGSDVEMDYGASSPGKAGPRKGMRALCDLRYMSGSFSS